MSYQNSTKGSSQDAGYFKINLQPDWLANIVEEVFDDILEAFRI
jgi:hypothetical protein